MNPNQTKWRWLPLHPTTRQKQGSVPIWYWYISSMSTKGQSKELTYFSQTTTTRAARTSRIGQSWATRNIQSKSRLLAHIRVRRQKVEAKVGACTHIQRGRYRSVLHKWVPMHTQVNTQLNSRGHKVKCFQTPPFLQKLGLCGFIWEYVTAYN